MTKAESRKAAKEGWRVRDDFYAIGTVVGERGPDYVLVLWDSETDPHPCHHNRLNREAPYQPHT
jgi:hypothetical protein